MKRGTGPFTISLGKKGGSAVDVRLSCPAEDVANNGVCPNEYSSSEPLRFVEEVLVKPMLAANIMFDEFNICFIGIQSDALNQIVESLSSLDSRLNVMI